MIGGNVCHLCGATLKSIDQTSVLKKDGSNKMDYRCTEYRCGTAVIQNFGKTTRVEVGSNCIIF